MKAPDHRPKGGGYMPAAQLAGQRKVVARRVVQAQKLDQRVESTPKARPDDATLKRILKEFISNKKGSCAQCAQGVYHRLESHVDGVDGDNRDAQLITWAENAGTQNSKSRNHTAATAIWEGAKVVIDTTAGQFGGVALFIGSVAAWRLYILGLVRSKDCRVSDAQFEEQETPFTASVMQQTRLTHERAHPRRSAHGITEARPGGEGGNAS